jgi:ankyrin repeat protein
VASAFEAVRSGDVEALARFLQEDPSLANAQVQGSRTLLHVATDWPGHFPNGPEVIRTLVRAGADVNVHCEGDHQETPLHWAASTDDVKALNALVECGADLEAPGSVIDGGTALSDAVAFGQWRAARRLVELGATTGLWHAAALGMIDRVRELAPDASPEEVTSAFWCACHGGQRETAEYLLDQGADINWVGHDELTPLDAARRSEADELVPWLESRGARSA